MDVKTKPIPLRLADETTGTVEGYASTWGPPADAYGHVVAKSAFANSLARHAAEGSGPAMLWAHDQSQIVGRWVSMREDDFGLFVRGKLNLGTTAGREAHAHLLAGDLNGLSIGVRLDPASTTKNADGTTLLREMDLAEISLVAIPANERARITAVKSRTPETNLLAELAARVSAATKGLK